MQTKMIECTNGFNWGKFLVGRFTPEEWAVRSSVDGVLSLIGGRGWTLEHLLVLDIQTGEGAIFRPGGSAKADLDKHQIWVCPLFEPFLTWLYTQPLGDLDQLGTVVMFTEEQAPSSMYGHRRAGPDRKRVIREGKNEPPTTPRPPPPRPPPHPRPHWASSIPTSQPNPPCAFCQSTKGFYGGSCYDCGHNSRGESDPQMGPT